MRPTLLAVLVMTAGAFGPTTANGQANGQRGPSTQPLPAQQQVPKNLNFVDTITVGRLPTGGCDWSKAGQRMRPGKPGTSTIPGPVNEKTCTALAYNVTYPPQDQTGMKVDTATAVMALTDGEAPSPTAFADVNAAVRRTFAKPDTIHISNVRVKGDSAWATVQHSPYAWTRYTLVRRSGAWDIVSRLPARR